MKKDNNDLLARELGKQLASRRMASGLTQEDVAERLGVGIEAVSRMERGVAVPNALRLLTLADILSCRIDELLQSTSPRSQDQAIYIQQLLDRINETDRSFLISMLENWVKHLQKQQSQ